MKYYLPQIDTEEKCILLYETTVNIATLPNNFVKALIVQREQKSKNFRQKLELLIFKFFFV